MNHYVDEFLKKALEQVKYKKIHPYLAQELNDHIESLKEEFMEEGLDEEKAYQKAVEEMGEPKQIGERLHAIHKPKIEWSIILTMIVIIGMGIFSLSLLEMQSERHSDYGYIARQMKFIIIGVISFCIVYFIDYQKIEKLSVLLYIVASGLLIATLMIGREINGLRCTLNIGGIGIRTIHCAVPLFIISYVGLIRKWANRGIVGYGIIGVTGIIAAILCMMISFTEGLYVVVVLLSIFISYILSKSFKGNRKKITRSLISGGLLGTALLTWYICHSPQRVERIMAWINPGRDPNCEGYLPRVMREILSGSILFGKGTGDKIQSIHKYLSGLETDCMFIFIISIMGYAVAGAIIVVITIMLSRCFKVSKKVSDEYGKMLLQAISIFFAMQYIMSVLVNLSLVPITAVSIPFMSYGSSRIICDFALMGFFLGIYRRKDIVPRELLEIKEIEVQNKKYNNLIVSWALNVLKGSEDIEEVNIKFKPK